MTHPAQHESPEPLLWGRATAPAATPTEKINGPRYRELDCHRGIAAVLIVIFTVFQFCNVHGALYAGSPVQRLLNSLDAAVPWFFVLTGFLVFLPVARAAIDGAPVPSTRELFAHRSARLLPVYVIAVLVVWFYRQDSLPGEWRDLLEHLTFTQVFDEKRIFYTIGPGWAVSVVALFYVLVAALSAVLPRWCRRFDDRRQRITAMLGVTAGLAAFSLAWRTVSFASGARPVAGSFTLWFGPGGNLDVFAAGMALAVIVTARGDDPGLSPKRRWILRGLAAAILAVAVAVRDGDGWTGAYFTSLCSLGFACLIAAAVSEADVESRHRSRVWSPLAWLGTISYGIFIWHEPVLLALNNWHGLIRQETSAFGPDTAVLLGVSTLVGWLSYSLIERPIMLLFRMFPRASADQTGSAATTPSADASCGVTPADWGAAG